MPVNREIKLSVSGSFFGKGLHDAPEFSAWQGKDVLESAGINFTNPSAASEFWMFDFDLRSVPQLLRFPRSARRLLIFEPESVNPWQHREFVKRLFSTVYVFSRNQKSRDDLFVPGGGFFQRPEEMRSEEAEFKFDVAIATSNKFSLLRGSQYQLRREAMESLAALGLRVGVAGSGWPAKKLDVLKAVVSSGFRVLTSGRFPSLKLALTAFRKTPRNTDQLTFIGRTENLRKFYLESKVILVIENDPNFLSEKPYEAIGSLRPLVYVGTSEFSENCTAKEVFPVEPSVDAILNAVNAALTSSEIEPSWAREIWAYRNEDAFLSRLQLSLRKELNI